MMQVAGDRGGSCLEGGGLQRDAEEQVSQQRLRRQARGECLAVYGGLRPDGEHERSGSPAGQRPLGLIRQADHFAPVPAVIKQAHDLGACSGRGSLR